MRIFQVGDIVTPNKDCALYSEKHRVYRIYDDCGELRICTEDCQTRCGIKEHWVLVPKKESTENFFALLTEMIGKDTSDIMEKVESAEAPKDLCSCAQFFSRSPFIQSQEELDQENAEITVVGIIKMISELQKHANLYRIEIKSVSLGDSYWKNAEDRVPFTISGVEIV